jgi:hypothetical protein
MALPWWLQEQGYTYDGETGSYSGGIQKVGDQWYQPTTNEDGYVSHTALAPHRQLSKATGFANDARRADGKQWGEFVPEVLRNTPGIQVIDTGGGNYRVAVPEDQFTWNGDYSPASIGPVWGGQNTTQYSGARPDVFDVDGKTYYALANESNLGIKDAGLGQKSHGRFLGESALEIAPYALALTGVGGLMSGLAANGLAASLPALGVGAAKGAGMSLLTGGDPVKGALTGGISGGSSGGSGMWDWVSNLFSGSDAGSSMSDFLANDAAQLAQQGVSGDQLQTLMMQSGADAFTAADIAQLVGQGITDPAQLGALIQQSTGSGVGSLGGVGGGTGGGGVGSTMMSALGKNPQLLGALLGGAAGGLGGSKGPAGTTTTTTDVPDYQRPYVQDLLSQARSTYQANQANPAAQTLANHGAANMDATIRGDYLDPSTNPWLKKTYDMAADSVGSGVDSRFTASGRYGSGAHQGVLGKTFGDLATNIYGGNYQQERGRQMTAALGAPEYASAYQQVPYGNLNNYANIAGKSFGSQTQQPYFNAPAGQSILGGALTGAMAGKMLGGFDFGSMFK